MLKNLALGILSTLIVLFTIEFLARILITTQFTDKYWRVSTSNLGDFQSNLDFIEVNRSRGIPFRVITNSQGLRNSTDFQIDKPENVFRILAIGDSFTFSFGVNNADAWTHLLEENLNQLSDQKIEVINAGFPGYTIKDEFEYLQQKGLKLHPDLVILGAFENDLNDFSPSSQSEFSRQQKLTRTSKLGALVFLEHSVAFNWANNTLPKLTSKSKKSSQLLSSSLNTRPNNSITLEYQQNYLNILKQLLALLESHNTPLLVVYFPNPHFLAQPTPDVLETLLDNNSTTYPLVDLRQLLQSAGTLKQLFLLPQDAHLSRYGNIVVATYLTDEIMSLYQDSLPKKSQ